MGGTKMQKNTDRSKVLNELFRISKMGMEASEIILPRTHGRGLSEQIKRQDENYINLMEKSRALLKQQNEEPLRRKEKHAAHAERCNKSRYAPS